MLLNCEKVNVHKHLYIQFSMKKWGKIEKENSAPHLKSFLFSFLNKLLKNSSYELFGVFDVNHDYLSAVGEFLDNINLFCLLINIH